jgi:hypothetical protein
MRAEPTSRRGLAKRARAHRVPVFTGGRERETPSCVPSTAFSDMADIVGLSYSLCTPKMPVHFPRHGTDRKKNDTFHTLNLKPVLNR